MNNSNIPFNRRKASLLSACFLLALATLVACKKETNTIGSSGLNPESLLKSGGVDTFSLETYTVIDDSIKTDDAIYTFLGAYHDPLVGVVAASFYTQLRYVSLPSLSPTQTITIDSMVLALSYGGFYGNKDEQTVEIYSLTDTLALASNYYMYSTKPTDAVNLVTPGKGTFKPDNIKNVKVGKDTLKPQLRISLDTNFARKIITDVQAKDANLSTNELFTQNYLKGIHVKVSDNNPSENKGGICYFGLGADDSKMTIYYKISGETAQYQFNFSSNSNCADFNSIMVNNNGKKLAQAINNSSEGSSQFFAQAFNARAAISIKGIKNFTKKHIIQEAILVLPVAHQTGQPYDPSTEISIAGRLAANSTSFYQVGNPAQYDKSQHRYVLNVRDYVQAVVSKKIDYSDLYVAPRLFASSAERIIFNGVNTTNKLKPRLIVKYTEY